VYDNNGRVKTRRVVTSTFIVYQSPSTGTIGELRNVVSVDGRPVENADKRAQDFFAEIAGAANSARERERIEKEGTRFDESIFINGLTLFQAVVLADDLRPAFDFSVRGQENVNDSRCYVVSYEQARESPYISFDPKRMVNDGKPELVYDLDLPSKASARVKGRFWIDAATYQIRKEERRIEVRRDPRSTPAVAVETVLEYENSPFAVLTPRRIVFTQYRRLKDDGPPRKDTSVTFEYEKFTKPDVEVKGAEIKN
jgi:hypothetical protein